MSIARGIQFIHRVQSMGVRRGKGEISEWIEVRFVCKRVIVDVTMFAEPVAAAAIACALDGDEWQEADGRPVVELASYHGVERVEVVDSEHDLEIKMLGAEPADAAVIVAHFS